VILIVNCQCQSLLYLAPPLGVTLQSPLKFPQDLWHQKTTVHSLLHGVVCVILHMAVLVELPTCDRRTDRWMDKRRVTAHITLALARRCAVKLYSNICTYNRNVFTPSNVACKCLLCQLIIWTLVKCYLHKIQPHVTNTNMHVTQFIYNSVHKA